MAPPRADSSMRERNSIRVESGKVKSHSRLPSARFRSLSPVPIPVQTRAGQSRVMSRAKTRQKRGSSVPRRRDVADNADSPWSEVSLLECPPTRSELSPVEDSGALRDFSSGRGVSSRVEEALGSEGSVSSAMLFTKSPPMNNPYTMVAATMNSGPTSPAPLRGGGDSGGRGAGIREPGFFSVFFVNHRLNRRRRPRRIRIARLRHVPGGAVMTGHLRRRPAWGVRASGLGGEASGSSRVLGVRSGDSVSESSDSSLKSYSTSSSSETECMLPTSPRGGLARAGAPSGETTEKKTSSSDPPSARLVAELIQGPRPPPFRPRKGCPRGGRAVRLDSGGGY